MDYNTDPVEAAKTGMPLPTTATRTSASLPIPVGNRFEAQKGVPAPSGTLDKYGNDTTLTRELEQRLKGLQDFNQKFETPAPAQTSSLPQPTMLAMPDFSKSSKFSSPFAQHDA